MINDHDIFFFPQTSMNVSVVHAKMADDVRTRSTGTLVSVHHSMEEYIVR